VQVKVFPDAENRAKGRAPGEKSQDLAGFRRLQTHGPDEKDKKDGQVAVHRLETMGWVDSQEGTQVKAEDPNQGPGSECVPTQGKGRLFFVMEPSQVKDGNPNQVLQGDGCGGDEKEKAEGKEEKLS
jgi:hypothetical protein